MVFKVGWRQAEAGCAWFFWNGNGLGPTSGRHRPTLWTYWRV